MPPKARNGFTQHAAPGAAPCSSRTCAIGRRSNAHSAAPQLNGFASFRGFLPGALSNACPSGPGRPSRIAREGQASNKARPLLSFVTSIVYWQVVDCSSHPVTWQPGVRRPGRIFHDEMCNGCFTQIPHTPSSQGSEMDGGRGLITYDTEVCNVG